MIKAKQITKDSLSTSQRSVMAVRGGSSPPAHTQIAAVSWRPLRELELSEWVDCGRRLGSVGRSVAWWIGDWLQYGNVRYGERYPRAAKITGYDTQSLMNMVWVASRFASDRRRDGLSWSHHAEVAALAPAEQEVWLDRAESVRRSVRCLRTELRAIRRAILSPEPTRSNGGIVCPHCGGHVSRRAGRSASAELGEHR